MNPEESHVSENEVLQEIGDKASIGDMASEVEAPTSTAVLHERYEQFSIMLNHKRQQLRDIHTEIEELNQKRDDIRRQILDRLDVHEVHAVSEPVPPLRLEHKKQDEESANKADELIACVTELGESSTRAIADKVGLGYQATYMRLRALAQKGIIRKETKGKITYFYPGKGAPSNAPSNSRKSKSIHKKELILGVLKTTQERMSVPDIVDAIQRQYGQVLTAGSVTGHLYGDLKPLVKHHKSDREHGLVTFAAK